MKTFALILFFHVGIWGDTDSNASSVVQGFTSEASCEAAGAKAKRLVSGSKKEMEYVCVEQ
jgi:hypothetical protein